MPLTPRQVAEQVRKMVAGEEVVFADLFAADGVLAYPFAPPGQPPELRGRDAIRDYFFRRGQSRELFIMEGVDAEIWETGDPGVVITRITHHGQSIVTGGPYTFAALGVIRVRDGEIARYDDYMDPIALARLLGRTADLAAALAAASV
jgi:ketosteroid isomerase-like protein